VDYWLVTTGEDKTPGINGGITARMDPVKATTNTADVPSVDEFVKKIIAAGGKVVVPKNAVPGVGWLAYCADTEANVFGIMQNESFRQVILDHLSHPCLTRGGESC